MLVVNLSSVIIRGSFKVSEITKERKFFCARIRYSKDTYYQGCLFVWCL